MPSSAFEISDVSPLVICGRLAALQRDAADVAEAMAAVRAGKGRRHRRSAPSWTDDDEARFEACLATLCAAREHQFRGLLSALAKRTRATP